jgi:hypothetical protein
MIQSFRDLQIWQKSMQVALAVYRLTKDFPREELYGLTSQIRRSAVSVPSNIAEGQGGQTLANSDSSLGLRAVRIASYKRSSRSLTRSGWGKLT